MPLSQLTETLGIKRAAHLLRRTCFGATPQQIRDFAALTPGQAVDRLFAEDLPEPIPPIDPETGREWVISGKTEANSEEFVLEGLFLNWKIAQMLSAGVPAEQSLSYAFREKLVFFLHTHFTTKRSTVGSSQALYYQDRLFRQFAFDKEDKIIPPPTEEDTERTAPVNFKVLANKVSVDNAMLRFLDGRLNIKGNPNENFSRELLELYTIGRGLEGALPEPPQFDGDYIYFTEEDVQEGARVLSGFNTDSTFSNLDADTGLPRGIVKGGNVATQHDTGLKKLSFRLGETEIAANPELTLNGLPTEESTIDEIAQLIDAVFAQDETAGHIMRRVYRFFVYHDIDESLYNTVIRDLADVFRANDYKLYPVLRALFTSKHFYDAEETTLDNNFGGIIKSPLEVVLGFARTFNLPLPNPETDLEGYNMVTGEYRQELKLMGLDLYEPFEVAGYPAYHQYPIYYRSWITTNYLTNRYNYIRKRIALSATDVEMGQVATITWFLENFPVSTIRNAKNLIAELATLLLPVSDSLSFETGSSSGEITPERLGFFYNEFLFREGLAEPGEEAWNAIWDTNYDADIISERLAFLLNAMLQTPEYQLT